MRSLRLRTTVALSAALALAAPAAASAAEASAAVNGSGTKMTLKAPVGKSASGSPTIGAFSARALDDQGEVSPQTYFTLDLPPGGSYSGQVLVTSSSKKHSRLRAYSVDGLTGATTGTVYANRDDPRKETSTWIEPKRDILHLDGLESRKLAFEVHVPQDAAPGDHVGAIAFESGAVPKSTGQFAVKEIIRVAVAVQIRVSGNATAKLELGAQKIEALGGTQMPSITTQLSNTGGLLCRPEISIALSKGGEPLGTVKRQLDTILPGDSIPYPLPWPKPLQAGDYQAKTTTTGCGPAASASANLTLKGALRGSQANPGTTLDAPGATIPTWAIVLIGSLGAIVLFGAGFILARRKPKKDEQPPAAPAAA